MRMRHAAVVAGLALGLMSGAAKAAYTVNIDQVGANVVATGKGSIDTSSFLFDSNTVIGSFIQSQSPSSLIIGNSTFADLYDGFNFPTFGTGPFTVASSSSGNTVGFLGGYEGLFVPTGYVANAPLGTSISTFDNTTLAGLGLTPGSSFTYTFPGSGPESFPDTFTINVSAVPLPASAPMFGAALLALGAVGYGMKRKKAAAAA